MKVLVTMGVIVPRDDTQRHAILKDATVLTMRDEDLMKIKELAGLLGVQPGTIYKWRKREKRTGVNPGPAAVTINGRLRWRRSDVNDWIKTKEQTP